MCVVPMFFAAASDVVDAGRDERAERDLERARPRARRRRPPGPTGGCRSGTSRSRPSRRTGRPAGRAGTRPRRPARRPSGGRGCAAPRGCRGASTDRRPCPSRRVGGEARAPRAGRPSAGAAVCSQWRKPRLTRFASCRAAAACVAGTSRIDVVAVVVPRPVEHRDVARARRAGSARRVDQPAGTSRAGPSCRASARRAGRRASRSPRRRSRRRGPRS